ncbi:Amino acid transporter transmembrane [Macrophomina phaseolina MS6]|uniref:Amino acid transporter transmembrane n=2 Tax=Macrophomina phaseolina TaxID=35725 RepID=K2RMQ3_MACPH|nr:Amino acid transporter transmembrane [Macrophomina phaseolina MS6]KAH7051208.1 transmembrane amino acid transporter protein-domain-containing protein [Macrophomina phaseolina]
MTNPRKQPTTWDEYDGTHRGSFDSSIQWNDDDERPARGESSGFAHQLRERRSSMSMRFNSIRHAGGVNSIDNFARSWQRAAGFYEVQPLEGRAFRFSEGDDADARHGDIESTPGERRSLLREAFENEGRRASDNAVAVDEEGEGPIPTLEGRLNASRTGSFRDSIFSIEPSLDSPFGSSYGTRYGSLRGTNESALRHAGRLFQEQQLKGTTQPDQDREPLLVKQVEEDGHVINVVVGQSTLPQTVFNSVNVLIGVGLLSLPLALKYSGWVVGITFFIFASITTQYTAKLLAKCLDVDNSLITFADLAYVSFGHRARVAVSILFTLELLATCVALVVLFADSLDALIPGIGLMGWKIVCGIVLIPLGFLPLRLLSFTSVLGIVCCLGIVIMVFIDGAIKPHQPGSLQEPAKTYLFPENWMTIPLSFGLLMSPWGGHSVFPNIYRDMRHPYKYRKGVNITYSFTFLLDLSMAVVGLLMFGDGVREEITSNILLTEGYPEALSLMIAIGIAIIPLTKVPLNARPIISTVELFLGLDARTLAATQSLHGTSGLNRGILKLFIRILTTVVFVIIAIIFPSFDRIMTLLGAIACFSVCLILPLAFHIKLFGKELGFLEYWSNWALIVVSTIMAVVSTIFACLPKELIGA